MSVVIYDPLPDVAARIASIKNKTSEISANEVNSFSTIIFLEFGLGINIVLRFYHKRWENIDDIVNLASIMKKYQHLIGSSTSDISEVRLN